MSADKKNSGEEHSGGKKKKPGILGIPRWVLTTTALSTALGGLVLAETYTSYYQSKIFSRTAKGKINTKIKTTGPETAAPASGPYDERLGYTQTLHFRRSGTGKGYELVEENSWLHREILGVELTPIYNRKSQAGLKITDDTGETLYAAQFPRQAYAAFDDLPPLLVHSLLFVENRELLADHPKTWNPAIEWTRLVNAALGYAGITEHSGGSTLATQIEKFHHSPDGVTRSPGDKLRQMLTASVRAYEDGEDTVAARRRIVLEYLNAMPLSSYPKFGEVAGFSDGMTQWYGRDMKDVNRLLAASEEGMSAEELRARAKVYREALSLVMAVKKPTAYLVKERAELEKRIDAFLPRLATEGIISQELRDAALKERLSFADPANHPQKNKTSAPPKFAQTLRVDLLDTLRPQGTDRKPAGLYDLDRYDLAVRTTIDAKVSEAVTKTLQSLAEAETAAASGLTGFRLLNSTGADQVIYTLAIYEKTENANLLRVQTDNFDGPLNLNEGSKLELGSTAKLRTLVSYLECVADFHKRFAAADAEALASAHFSPRDEISRWAAAYLLDPVTDKSLPAMLEAALDRTYSANPGESFFTGGGLHRFVNFDGDDNGRSLSVRESFHRSVNLPFIRMMRDIVSYTMTHKMNVDPALFEDGANEDRREYLEKFADAEGRSFMWKFYRDHKAAEGDIAAHLAKKTRGTPMQLAVLYRSVYPDAPVEKMEAFIRQECKNCDNANFAKLYKDYAPGKFNLNDRGYLTRIHPLELWLAHYRLQNPGTTWEEAAKASADVRIEVYKWLLDSENMSAQNTRIRTMLEKEAFHHIHDTWKEKGFPFPVMIPSYASALGASGDTPAALAELAGVLQNDGMRKPTVQFREIHFADDTPYELQLRHKDSPARQVLAPEIARLVRKEMQGVVEKGTARRAFQSVRLSNGKVLALGGKTGTGDNRLETHGANGSVRSSNVTSRTAAFVFTIDDKFYGSLIAYVPGESAATYKFTSALPVQVFKTLVNDIRPLLDRAEPELHPIEIPEPRKKKPVAPKPPA